MPIPRSLNNTGERHNLKQFVDAMHFPPNLDQNQHVMTIKCISV